MGFEPRRFDANYELDWLKLWTRYSPTRVAFEDADSGAEWTFATVYFLSCKLAHHLKTSFDIQTGDRVAVLSGNSMEYLALFFALQRLGAILVPVNFRLTPREIEHILSDVEPKLLLCQNQFQAAAEQAVSLEPGLKGLLFWPIEGENGLEAVVQSWFVEFAENRGDETVRYGKPHWSIPFAGSPDSACMILYTSGTTGFPKGAIITNSMLHWNSINTCLRLNITPQDVALSFLPFFHTGGWNVLLTPFVQWGAKTIIMKKFDADYILLNIEKENVTILFGVPTTMDMMFRSPLFAKTDFSKVRYAIVGGEPMAIELIRAWQQKGVPIRQGFGMTEFGPNVFSLNEEDSLRKIGSIGYPNFFVETRVVDENGRDVEVDEIGELLLKGPACMPGYWRNPKATEETIRNGWMYTGDLVRVDSEGYFYVAGRRKDMFKSGGENVYPVEVEQVISQLQEIREVAVIGVSDTKWGEVGRAYLSLKDGSNLSASDVRSHCERFLAKFKIPKEFVFMADLPKGDSGKILKKKLRDLDAPKGILSPLPDNTPSL